MAFKFFLSPYKSPEKSNYQHLSVALAEGLLSLGIQVYGNIDYWYDLSQKEFLIKEAPLDYAAEIHVYNISYLRNRVETKLDLSKANILLDASDGIFNEVHDGKYDRFDLILKTHYNRHLKYPQNVKAWAFGLTNRMTDACEKTLNNQKKICVLQNFRVTHNLRKDVDYYVTPKLTCLYKVEEFFTNNIEPDEFMSYWVQTGRRHNSEFYGLLNQTLFTYCFGGDLVPKSIEPNFQSVFYRKFYKLRRKLYSLFNIKNKNSGCLCQFDSWRFWESLISTTIPLHLDLNLYGCSLPVMPNNWIHYIGIEDIRKLDTFIEKLSSLTNEEINSIATKGREWALKNYSPVATAQRFINLIE